MPGKRVRISELPGRDVPSEPAQNDTPETAIPLKVGDKVLVSTAGTAAAPEAPCLLTTARAGRSRAR